MKKSPLVYVDRGGLHIVAAAGAAEMTKNPLALASALRKISADPDIEAVKREDVAQLFIQHPGQQDRKSVV